VSEKPAMSALMKASWRKSSAEAAKFWVNYDPLFIRHGLSLLREQ
jgi:hypothetical protein